MKKLLCLFLALSMLLAAGPAALASDNGTFAADMMSRFDQSADTWIGLGYNRAGLTVLLLFDYEVATGNESNDFTFIPSTAGRSGDRLRVMYPGLTSTLILTYTPSAEEGDYYIVPVTDLELLKAEYADYTFCDNTEEDILSVTQSLTDAIGGR